MNDLETSLIDLDHIMTQVFDSKKVKQSPDYETIKSLKFAFNAFMYECEEKMTKAWETVVREHSHLNQTFVPYSEVTELLYDPVQEDYYLQFSDTLLEKMGWQVNEELELKVVNNTIVITSTNGK